MKIRLILILWLSLPLAASAQTIGQYISDFIGVLFNVRVIVMAFAFLFFVYGIAKFIFNSGNESAKEEGKRFMVWSVIALFIIFSFSAIIAFMRGELPLPSTTLPMINDRGDIP